MCPLRCPTPASALPVPRPPPRLPSCCALHPDTRLCWRYRSKPIFSAPWNWRTAGGLPLAYPSRPLPTWPCPVLVLSQNPPWPFPLRSAPPQATPGEHAVSSPAPTLSACSAAWRKTSGLHLGLSGKLGHAQLLMPAVGPGEGGTSVPSSVQAFFS